MKLKPYLKSNVGQIPVGLRLIRVRILFLFAIILLMGCQVYRIGQFEQPEVTIPEKYHHEIQGHQVVKEWWKEFDDPKLNKVIDQAMTENLDIRQAWRRLDQALALANMSGSDTLPQVSLQSGGSRTRLDDGRNPRATNNRFFVSTGLTYEVDLWRRIASQRKAALLNYEATREDVEETALVLTGVVVDSWFRIQEQQGLLALLEEQMQTGSTLLELTELRFGLGKGSALDVFQQRQQLASITAQVPVTRASLETSWNQLAVLLGQPPGHIHGVDPGKKLPKLPELPNIGQPANLIDMRPDLRAALNRLKAADYDVAVAIADRLPRLSLSLSYEFSASKISHLFMEELGSMAGNLVAPLVDGKRRQNEVHRRQALVHELLNGFGQKFLEALLEIEDALALERHQRELIKRLEKQLGFAQSTLEESRSRYVNGLDDYLSVIIAIQALQDLQRRFISEEKSLLTIRSNLYRALGGQWMKQLKHPNSMITKKIARQVSP